MNGHLPSDPAPTNRSGHAPSQVPVAQLPLALDPATMQAALGDGTAVPLTTHVTSLVIYRGVWWLDDDDAWLQITDQPFAAHLNTVHERQQ